MSLISQFFNHPQRVIEYTFTENDSFTPITTGWHFFSVAGGGGSGAATRAAVHDGYRGVLATGGSAANLRVGWLLLSSAVTYTIVVGSGGAAVQVSTGSAVDGNAGTASSIAGTGITTVIGNGGKGGVGFIHEHASGSSTGENYFSSNNLALDNAANTAGSGPGSDWVGGKGGSITLNKRYADTNTDYICAATGGGALNIYGGSAGAGGDLASTDGALSEIELIEAATGGGGVGGSGGSGLALNSTTTGAEHTVLTSGGGSGGPATDVVADGGSSTPGVGATGGGLWAPTGEGGQDWADASTPDYDAMKGGAGGGGGAFRESVYAGMSASDSPDGGNFGGGAAVIQIQETNACYAGAGGFGAGGGGMAEISGSSTAYSGAGGVGVVRLIGYYSPEA